MSCSPSLRSCDFDKPPPSMQSLRAPRASRLKMARTPSRSTTICSPAPSAPWRISLSSTSISSRLTVAAAAPNGIVLLNGREAERADRGSDGRCDCGPIGNDDRRDDHYRAHSSPHRLCWFVESEFDLAPAFVRDVRVNTPDAGRERPTAHVRNRPSSSLIVFERGTVSAIAPLMIVVLNSADC